MNEYITIAIPFYNAEKFLKESIQSVLAQTYKYWELILIDDGSTDKSLHIARSFTDSRITVYSDGKNKKLAFRLNQVAELAKYDIIARMDADDLMAPNRLEKQIQVLVNKPNIDLVTTGLFTVTNNLKYIGARWYKKNCITHNELLAKNHVVHAAIMARKSWFLRNKYNTKLKVAQDYELWLRSSYNNDFKIYFLTEPLYIYREEGNISISKLFRASSYGSEMISKYADQGKLLKKSIIWFKFFVQLVVILFGLKLIILKKRSMYHRDSELTLKLDHYLRKIFATPLM